MATGARGYNEAHNAERRRWQQAFDEGQHITCARHPIGECLEPEPTIQPGTAWDLGHTEDRQGWTGPEHARCNRAAGGRLAGQLARTNNAMTIRDW